LNSAPSARLVADVAHQDEHRHGDELVLLHQADGLQVGEVEDRRAEADEAEDQREEQQREADRMPMKIATSITSSIDQRRGARDRSYLRLFPVLELAAEADLVAALQRLGHALDHEQQRRERHRGAERPHERRHGVCSDAR
jgi:hypothetical protein